MLEGYLGPRVSQIGQELEAGTIADVAADAGIQETIEARVFAHSVRCLPVWLSYSRFWCKKSFNEKKEHTGNSPVESDCTGCLPAFACRQSEDGGGIQKGVLQRGDWMAGGRQRQRQADELHATPSDDELATDNCRLKGHSGEKVLLQPVAVAACRRQRR